MKPYENALALLPLLVTLGCAATQSIPGTPGADFAPDRRPFVDQSGRATESAEPRSPTPNGRHFDVPQRGIPFAEEYKPKLEAQPKPGVVYSDAYIGEAGRLLAVPRIVADESTVAFLGFSSTPEEREKFDKERAQRINGRVNQRVQQELRSVTDDPKAALGCIAALILCPVVLPIAYGVVWAGGQATGRIGAAIQEPRLIPEADGSRLAAALRERLSGASLQERTRRLAGGGYRPAADEEALAPRLAVHFTEVALKYAGRHISLTVTAQAQASPAAGNDWQPSKHIYRSPARPLSAWTADSDALVLQEIENALEALASNIWTTYSPSPARAVAARLPAEGALESAQSGK